jgi:hypothetical protein
LTPDSREPAPFAAILLAILVSSALLMSALGIFDLPAPPTAEQIVAAERHLNSVCDAAGAYGACPVYEIKILEPAATAAADDTNYPPWLSRTLP